jgi:LPXTG-motif cell wall-anchored protein
VKHIRATAVTLSALALMAVPATALADGAQPFKNCSEAYAAGYADIPAGDPHYAERLDRDGDGIGCDQPPSDFQPSEETSGNAEDGTSDDSGDTATEQQAAGQDDPGLAETGGNGATPYYAAGGAVVLLAGAGVLVAARKRRAQN